MLVCASQCPPLLPSASPSPAPGPCDAHRDCGNCTSAGDGCAWCGPLIHPEEGFCAQQGSQCSSVSVSDPGQVNEAEAGGLLLRASRILDRPRPPTPLQCPSLSGNLAVYRAVEHDVTVAYAAVLASLVCVALCAVRCMRTVATRGSVVGLAGEPAVSSNASADVVFLFRVGVLRVV